MTLGESGDGFVLVFSSQDYYEAQFARGTLEATGIEVKVTGLALQTGATGGVPFQQATLQLYVPAADEERAREILEQMEQTPEEHESWLCRHCGTEVEGVFTRCWKCGCDQA